MNIFTDISQIEKNKNTVLTIGTFDGIHQGHLGILNKVIEISERNNNRSFAITFHPHPRMIINEGYRVNLLTSLEEKIKIFESVGIENLLIVKFTEEFSETSYEDFINEFICDKIGCSNIVIGYDHKFGKGRSGNEDNLNDLAIRNDFEVSVVEPVIIAEQTISSTMIRKLLLNGEIGKANTFLSSNYKFFGRVIEGCKRGRTLGFPTANVHLFNDNKLIPANGVYLTKIYLGDEVFYSITNVGVRPTFENDNNIVIEAHLLEFDRMIYGKSMTVEFLSRIRDEKKFVSKDELIKQINIDKQEALRLLKPLVN